MENQIQATNLKKTDRRRKTLTFIYPLFILYFLEMGLFTYLLTFLIVTFMEKVLKKRDNQYQITSKKITIIVLFIYFIEQYLILKDLKVIYSNIILLLLGIYIINYLLFDFKFEIKSIEMWFNIILLIVVLLFIYSNGTFYLKMDSLNLIYFLVICVTLWRILKMMVYGYENKVFPSILIFKLGLAYIKTFGAPYPIRNGIISIYFRKCINIIIVLITMFLLKKLYDNLKSFKVITIEEKLRYIFYVIIGIYFLIQVFFTVIIDY